MATLTKWKSFENHQDFIEAQRKWMAHNIRIHRLQKKNKLILLESEIIFCAFKFCVTFEFMRDNAKRVILTIIRKLIRLELMYFIRQSFLSQCKTICVWHGWVLFGLCWVALCLSSHFTLVADNGRGVTFVINDVNLFAAK